MVHQSAHYQHDETDRFQDVYKHICILDLVLRVVSSVGEGKDDAEDPYDDCPADISKGARNRRDLLGDSDCDWDRNSN